ncbi:acyl-CoA N-acyltransferase [Microthyrium microscopicum]|uniref:Acyl-CoA N-acyltransferase n=1 Tax=Microthyrium microscopicum TaxID=703497 RepID=A0A6A6TZ69_9PEZI|nr:acyl-CoA N-acyltransferase [Microthyrium microscopicum]
MEFASAYKSARLQYRAMEDNEEDRKFIHENIQTDPTTLALSCGIINPQKKSDTEKLIKIITENTIVCVIISLPQPPKEPTTPISVHANFSTEGSKDGDDIKDSIIKPEPIGFVHVRKSHSGNAQLGIALVEKYQGKGYGPEAINWAVDHTFNYTQHHRVEIQCLDFNVFAQKAYERLGFVEEGRMRECAFFKRKWHDIIMFSMLESDWMKLRGLE